MRRCVCVGRATAWPARCAGVRWVRKGGCCAAAPAHATRRRRAWAGRLGVSLVVFGYSGFIVGSVCLMLRDPSFHVHARLQAPPATWSDLALLTERYAARRPPGAPQSALCSTPGPRERGAGGWGARLSPGLQCAQGQDHGGMEMWVPACRVACRRRAAQPRCGSCYCLCVHFARRVSLVMDRVLQGVTAPSCSRPSGTALRRRAASGRACILTRAR